MVAGEIVQFISLWLLQRTWNWFPELKSDCSQPPMTLVAGDPTPSASLIICRQTVYISGAQAIVSVCALTHACAHAYVHARANTQIHTQWYTLEEHRLV